MFKKNDILPLILALVSTVLIVAAGFTWLTKHNIAGLGKSNLSKNSILKASDAQANLSPSPSSITQENFVVPAIVPQGTSVSINGSDKLDQINTALRKGFHRQYPGTIIITDADGNDVGLNLLSSGDIDLLALDRPLNKAEQTAGLIAIQIDKLKLKQNQTDSALYYVYREPLDPDIEAFLGYAFSESGKKAINSH